MNLLELENTLATILLQHDDGSDGSHDIHHARRVLLNAKEIARRESAEVDLRHLMAAAYLHDLVNVSKDSPQRDQASRLSAEAAGPILEKLGFITEEIIAIQHSITAHSFSANIQPETLEAKILGVAYAVLADRVRQGGSDREVLEWCYDTGRRPSAEDVVMWNDFMTKRGWRDLDAPASELQEYKETFGFGHRTDILTYFEFFDVDEGRKP